MFSHFITFMLFLSSVQCLVQLSNNDTLSHTIIRDTINKLFSNINLNVTSKLNEHLILNKYFTSISLQDVKRNEIKRLIKVNIDNTTQNFVGVINEVLNDINDSKVDDVVFYIQYFLKYLADLKENNKNISVNINTDVLKHLRNIESLNKSREYNASDVLLEDEFWEPSGRRVYRGERSKIKHFPFMASIHIFNSFQCAGSIIKSDLVITACSCLQLAWNNRFFRENPSFLSTRVGSSFYKGGGEVIPVLEVYFHPGYHPKTLHNNVCIIRLTRHVMFRRKRRAVKKIDFDRSPHQLAVNTPEITIVGWGAKDHTGIISDPWKNIISYSDLNIYPFRDCQDVYSKEYVTNKNFCAGFFSRGGGACNRDVGGPGIVGGKLVGIISFGPSVCGSPDAPTVFTKVGYYAEWIQEIMEQDVAIVKKRTTLSTTFDYYKKTTWHPRPEKTTFKIAPIAGKLRPTSVVEQDNVLRIFDKDLFNEFLTTMFNSKEIEDYKDLLDTIDKENNIKATDVKEVTTKDVTKKPKENTKVTKKVTYLEDIIEPVTKIIDFEDDTTEKVSEAFTVLDKDLDISGNIIKETDITEFIDDIDLEKIIKEEVLGIDVTDTDVPNNSEILDLTDFVDSPEDIDLNAHNHVSSETFVDLTRTASNVLSEAELYKIFSEVLREEISNKTFEMYCLCY